MSKPTIIKQAYKDGRQLFNQGASVRDIITKVMALHDQEVDWKPPADDPKAEPPDFESEGFSLVVGFADGVLDHIRNLHARS